MADPFEVDASTLACWQMQDADANTAVDSGPHGLHVESATGTVSLVDGPYGPTAKQFNGSSWLIAPCNETVGEALRVAPHTIEIWIRNDQWDLTTTTAFPEGVFFGVGDAVTENFIFSVNFTVETNHRRLMAGNSARNYGLSVAAVNELADLPESSYMHLAFVTATSSSNWFWRVFVNGMYYGATGSSSTAAPAWTADTKFYFGTGDFDHGVHDPDPAKCSIAGVRVSSVARSKEEIEGSSVRWQSQIPETTGPTIWLVSPTDGSTLAGSDTPLVVDITDEGGLQRWFLTTEFEGYSVRECVHDGLTFGPNYVTNSTMENITGGARFTIVRDGGWLDNPSLTVAAIDFSGNETG